jgi:hypothetical protein
MPFLNQQTLVVNQELLKSSLNDSRFKSGRFEGIANEVIREGKTFPCIMSRENYEAQDITVDDTYPIIIYHKILAKRYDLNNIAGQKSEFGDRNKYVKETVLVKMVVYGKYSALKVSKEELEAIITTNFPDNMDAANNETLNSLGLDNVTYSMQSTNFLSKSVWSEEYAGNEFRLAPEDIFFAITYQIQSTWRKGCFQLCNCDYYLLTENGKIINTENGKHLKT